MNSRDPLNAFLESDVVKGLKSDEAMSELEWVEHAISLVNAPFVTEGLIRRLCASGGPEFSREGGRAIDGPIVGVIPDAERRRVAAWFDQIIADHGGAARKLRDEVLKAKGSVVCIPFPFEEAYQKGRRRISNRYRILCPNIEAALRYTLVLLLDEDLGIGKRLARCELGSDKHRACDPTCEPCHRYFLKSPERRRYCCDEHADRANAVTASLRVMASRKQTPLNEFLNRKSRRLKR